MFKSQRGFINTESSDTKTDEFEAKEFLEEEVSGNTINGVRLLIEVNGKRIYAAYGGINGKLDNSDKPFNQAEKGICVKWWPDKKIVFFFCDAYIRLIYSNIYYILSSQGKSPIATN
ncbi:hypothetical protein [Phocaeicola sp.]